MPFWELTVSSSPDICEGLTNFLWELGAVGVVEEEVSGTRPRLRAFFPEATPSTALSRAVSQYLASLSVLGMGVNGGAPVVTPLLDEPWAEAWRQAFRPQRAGRRLLIVPPWEKPSAEAGLTTIVIEPGRAFGTGTHGSTRGCLVLLETLLERVNPARALDIGTGTGILAIAAVALGVPRVTALDTDPDAVAAARANAALNGVEGRIECVLADATGADGPPFPLILSNLLAGSHTSLPSEYRRLAGRGGHLILGGILSDEADSVVGALAPHGFALGESTDVDGWASLLFFLAPARSGLIERPR